MRGTDWSGPTPKTNDLAISLFLADRIAVLRLSGQLLVRSAGRLRDALAQALAAQPWDIILDLNEVTGADPAAAVLLSALQRQARRHGVRLRLASVPHAVSAALRDIHLENRIRIHASVAAAAVAAVEER